MFRGFYQPHLSIIYPQWRLETRAATAATAVATATATKSVIYKTTTVCDRQKHTPLVGRAVCFISVRVCLCGMNCLIALGTLCAFVECTEQCSILRRIMHSVYACTSPASPRVDMLGGSGVAKRHRTALQRV